MTTLLITRTEPGASELAQQLEARDCSCVVAPVLRIEQLQPWRALVDDVAVEADQVDTGCTPALIVALSIHAVRGFLRLQVSRTVRDIECLAVGARTAAELRQGGFEVQTPQTASSEGLLAMPVLERLQAGDTVWVLAGVGGRALLLRHLRDVKGCRVVKFELYQRSRVAMQPFPADSIGAAVVGSEEGLMAFHEQWRARGGDLRIALIVPSERVAGTARGLGFPRVRVASGMDADSVWRTVQKLAG